MDFKASVETPLGLVAILDREIPVPAGWRRLRLEEGKQIKENLNEILEEWSIVGFEDGKLDGYGYGNNFSETSGAECGEGFIIKID